MIILALLAAVVAATPQLSVGGIVVKQSEIVDARIIADAAGKPVMMLTLVPVAAERTRIALATMMLDGKPVTAQLSETAIEVALEGSFEQAATLALALSGKPPLRDSMDD